jgi:D-alanyl-D-alanine dipeptidase
MKVMDEKKKILTYEEVVKVQLGENHERMVDVATYSKNIVAQYEKFDMAPFTGDKIFVRDALARKLAEVADALRKKENYILKVAYGYRHPQIQKKYFMEQRAKLALSHSALSSEELDSLTHNFIAVPSVAGHPTGGAVDITLATAIGEPLAMGTRIADFSDSEKIKTFSKDITLKEKNNRMMLRDALLKIGLAPFNGEWWHFSYGDREWACFYGEPKSLYSPIELQV